MHNIRSELSFLDRNLTYAKERGFVYPNAGRVTILQDIADVGGTVWDASIVLSHYLDSLGTTVLQGKSLVELGAGTAVPSIVASRLGARAVATDMKQVLLYTEMAIRGNCDQLHRNGRIRWQELIWGASGVGLEALKSTAYDYIVGADIVYNVEFFEDLIETLLALCPMALDHVEHPHPTTILLCFEQRRRNLTPLWAAMEMHFHVDMVTSPMLDACRHEANVFLYQLRRKR
ncbi:hypothetical protein H310_06402 [Aphanomyces invadans]|uniref:Uncharacterized protein n=1 Tax=Aphanomyces invadans TaxID=157072 RepID=A0A024U606_9STRA|nr:hypothetical protein H310_06402 [Aphanomyces invadans]ETW01831.1 hypothetical protein H310_06402 [Aphanomyces invadans]|eukprot:XP_008869679.1 hypothetical protein H310_06402 [Aphanomyces invadans]